MSLVIDHPHGVSFRDDRILWILRIGVAGCFIGHGAFGLITKAAWVPYFGVAGISESLAWQLMPWVGGIDVTIGLLALVFPCRSLFVWAALWATWTALLRPLAGEPVWELLERAGNYGVPLAILAYVGLRRPMFKRLTGQRSISDESLHTQLSSALKYATVTLLVGHAGLGLFTHKAGLAAHYAALGVVDPTALVPAIGAFEFLLAALVLCRPTPYLLVGIAGWKLATEFLFIFSGSPVWEVIERFGSYTAPLALAMLLTRAASPASSVLSPAPG
ncbi:MAG: hypothetical protein ABIZ04_07645 [Opitutus sp.]